MATDDTDSFVIHSSVHCGSIEFFDLEKDNTGTVEGFKIRLVDEGLSATIPVYALYAQHLPDYFQDLAEHWKGWSGVKQWASLEGELHLSATTDRRGHIALAVELNGGTLTREWKVTAVVPTEAGLLDRIAAECLSFFGEKKRFRVD